LAERAEPALAFREEMVRVKIEQFLLHILLMLLVKTLCVLVSILLTICMQHVLLFLLDLLQYEPRFAGHAVVIDAVPLSFRVPATNRQLGDFRQAFVGKRLLFLAMSVFIEMVVIQSNACAGFMLKPFLQIIQRDPLDPITLW